jgi:hypothetical protein
MYMLSFLAVDGIELSTNKSDFGLFQILNFGSSDPGAGSEFYRRELARFEEAVNGWARQLQHGCCLIHR